MNLFELKLKIELEILKKHISKPPILKLPNFEQELVLQME